MQAKESYCATLEECLERWSLRIKELEVELEGAEAEKKEDCKIQLQQLHRIGGQIKETLEEIRNAEPEHWESLKESAEKIRTELERTIRIPISRFK